MPIEGDPDVRSQREILQKIFDHIPAMINLVDAAGHIRLVNRQWERVLGWTLAEIQDQHVDVFAECYPDPRYRQYAIEFVAAGEGEWADFKTRVRDGRVIETSWASVRLSDGTTIGIGQDITERKRAQEAVRTFSRRLVEVQEAERRQIAREVQHVAPP